MADPVPGRLLGRTLDTLVRPRQLISPHFERALMLANWPEEYAIKVYNKERIWDGYFHPSSDAAAEALFLYYRFHSDYHDLLEYERPDPSLEMTFQIGSAMHSLIQSMLIHCEFTTLEECEVGFVNERHHCSGTLDIRKFFLPDGTSVPVEIKSASHLPSKPWAKNVLQLQVYMDLGCGEPQSQGSLFYVEKASPHRTREFVIERDPVLLEEVYSKWDWVREAIEFDPSTLRDCCRSMSIDHKQCPARMVCRIGPPGVVR